VITLTLVYAALLAVEVTLLVRYVRAGVAGAMPELDKHDDDSPSGGADGDRRDDVLAFAY
jgi:cytochrome d ubiquinol oxidase subunit I